MTGFRRSTNNKPTFQLFCWAPSILVQRLLHQDLYFVLWHHFLFEPSFYCSEVWPLCGFFFPAGLHHLIHVIRTIFRLSKVNTLWHKQPGKLCCTYGLAISLKALKEKWNCLKGSSLRTLFKSRISNQIQKTDGKEPDVFSITLICLFILTAFVNTIVLVSL